MKRYAYVGPVLIFGKITNPKWSGETLAVSFDKAKSNLMYQYKKQTGRRKDAKIEFTGKIYVVEE